MSSERKKKKVLIFDAQVHFAEQRGVWERKLPRNCVMCRLSLSACISVSRKRGDDGGCQYFNLTLVMMKSGHTTQIFCFLSIPEDFRLQISLYSLVIFGFFCFFFLLPSFYFLLGVSGLTFEKFLISDRVL